MLVSEQLRTYPSPNLTLPLTKLLSLLVSFCCFCFLFIFLSFPIFFFYFCCLFVYLFIYFFNIIAGLGEGLVRTCHILIEICQRRQACRDIMLVLIRRTQILSEKQDGAKLYGVSVTSFLLIITEILASSTILRS